MKNKELELMQKQKNDPIKETQILELKNTLNSDNSIVEEKIAYLTKQRDFFSHQYNSIQGKIEEINKEISKKQGKIGKTNKNLESLQEKLEKMNGKTLNTTEQLKKNAEELRSLLLKSSEGVNSSEASEKEQKVSSSLLQLDILRQEVLRKDSEIVLKLREKQKADEKFEGLKIQQNKLYSKMKTIEGEILEKINEELDTKDKQIMVLKEMLRGSHGELKVKDIVLHSFRNKLEEVSKSIR